MEPLTIRLIGRSIHLVRDPGSSQTCRDHETHVRFESGLHLRSLITDAVQNDASTLARLRALTHADGLLDDVHRVVDSMVLEHVAWLLDTGRLFAIECRPVINSGPILPAPARPTTEPPRGNRVPLEDPKTWVEIELLTEAGKPVPHQRYRVKLPDGLVDEGTLDAKGRARFTRLDPGMCEVSFPDLDGREWKQA